jgi:hypothetical protein
VDSAREEQISRTCLHGRALPRSLKVLWVEAETGNGVLIRTFGIERLLTDLTQLDIGYGEAVASESPDIAANIRAHRLVFEQIGFFAALRDDEFLGFWLRDDSPEPAVVRLDSEGQYAWLGITAAEALFHLGHNKTQDEPALRWLRENALKLAESSEMGASTQFLPDLGDLHAEMYYAYLGRPRARREQAKAPAHPQDPTTWLLRPGPEVQEAFTKFAGGPPMHFCVWCTGEGLVKAVTLGDQTPRGTTFLGISLGATRQDVEKQLGEPAKTGKGWIRYHRGGRTFRYGFDKDGAVKSITLGLED